MRNLLKKATLGIALGATALVAAAPAEAQRYRGGRHYGHHDSTGPAIVAGIAGLAIGAAVASGSRDRYYDRGYYNDGYRGGYYRNGYYRDSYRGYNRGYHQRCYDRRVYDRYAGRHVRVRYC